MIFCSHARNIYLGTGYSNAQQCAQFRVYHHKTVNFPNQNNVLDNCNVPVPHVILFIGSWIYAFVN